MTDFICTLGPVNFVVMPGGDFGQVLQALDFGQTARADVPRLAAVRGDSPRTFSFPAMIQAATKDESIAIITAANRALSVTNTLVVHSKDATQAVTFRTFPSGSVKQAPEQSWELSNWQQVQITITIEPYAYGDLIATTGTVNTPEVISLEDMPGEYTSPLALEFDAGADKLHSVYVALNEQLDWDGWITVASGLTWSSTGGTQSDAKAYNAAVAQKTTSTTRMYTDFETKDVPPGDYIVLVKAKTSNTANTGTIDIAQQSRWTVSIPTAANIWRYYEVGELALPYSIVRGTASSVFRLGVTSGNGSYYVMVDQIVLLPYRAGYQSWHGGTDSASYYYYDVFFDSDGAVYLDDVCHLENAAGAPIKSLSGELIVLADSDGGDLDNGRMSLTTTLSQIPRYSLYR